MCPLSIAGAFKDSRRDEATRGRRIPRYMDAYLLKNAPHGRDRVATELMHPCPPIEASVAAPLNRFRSDGGLKHKKSGSGTFLNLTLAR